jgi:hypothetical protein
MASGGPEGLEDEPPFYLRQSSADPNLERPRIGRKSPVGRKKALIEQLVRREQNRSLQNSPELPYVTRPRGAAQRLQKRVRHNERT